MKKIITIALVAFSLNSFAQSIVKNGTIYKEHPYITAVKEMNIDFAKGDTTSVIKFYADSAKFYDNTSPKSYTLAQTRAGWVKLFAEWDQITIKQEGYPDGLEYSSDPFTVQSWWIISAVNKKTQKKAKFYEVTFDEFNKDGKIVFEDSFYDPTSIIAAEKP